MPLLGLLSPSCLSRLPVLPEVAEVEGVAWGKTSCPGAELGDSVGSDQAAS